MWRGTLCLSTTGQGACQSLPVSVTKVTEISKEEKIYMIIRREGLLLKVLEVSSLWLLSLVLFRPVVSTVGWKPEVCVCWGQGLGCCSPHIMKGVKKKGTQVP